MKTVYEYQNHRVLLEDYIASESKVTRKQVAAAAGISSSLFSQILHGDRNLSSEQAYRIAGFMGLNDTETSYWLTLVTHNNTSAAGLKSFLSTRLNEMRQDAFESSRIRLGLKRTTWSQDFVAVFYSSWHFPAIYCVLALKGKWTANALALRLGIVEERVKSVLEFFTQHKIVERKADGAYVLQHLGYVYIDGKDAEPYQAAVLHNCKNFRQKAMAKLEDMQLEKNRDGEFQTITALMSESDIQGLRADIKRLLQKVNKRIAASNLEKVVCLNIDCFTI